MIAEPDAWDECAACGHDREEHDPFSGGCSAATSGIPDRCICRGFEAAA